MFQDNLNDQRRLTEALIKIDLIEFARSETRLIRDEIRQGLKDEADRQRVEAQQHRRRVWVTFGTLTILEMQKRVSRALSAEVESARELARQTLDQEAQLMRRAVHERLDKEFEQPAIRSLVAEQARQYAKNEAQAYIVKEMESVLTPYRDKVNGALADQRNTLKQYQGELVRTRDSLQGQVMPIQTKLSAFEEFMGVATLTALARNSDRRALDQIRKIMGTTKDSAIKRLCVSTYNAVYLEYADRGLYTVQSFKERQTKDNLIKLLPGSGAFRARWDASEALFIDSPCYF